MFEIGSALREARERKGLSFPQVEEATKIRARYIRALESEDFGVLPGATYTKGFLRAYADYLGLDGHLFIDEFNSRYHDPRREDEKAIYPPSRRRITRHKRETNIVLIALAAIVAIASLVFLGAANGGNTHANLPPAQNPTSARSTTTTTTKQTTTKKPSTAFATHSTKPKTYKISIAASGDSWISAHLGSAGGPAATTVKHTSLAEYLLHGGETAVIQAKGPVVINLGAPGNITITVAGHLRQLPAGFKFTITRKGIAKA
jgi:cytoskeleton protein RodZ